MGRERRDRERLLDALTERGWISEGDHVFAPRRTTWLLRASLWQGDLFDMLESMRRRLERIQRLAPVAGVGEQGEAADDTAELVLVLERLIGESSRRSWPTGRRHSASLFLGLDTADAQGGGPG